MIMMPNIGDKQTNAKALKPTLTNRNIESKNRRKSKDTLPPLSLAYVLHALVILLSVFVLSSSQT